jgi:transposase
MARSVATPSRKHPSLERLQSTSFHVGVDVHKRSYHVACWSEEHGLIASWVQPASPKLLIERLAPSQKNVQQIVYEAGRPASACSGICNAPVSPCRLLLPRNFSSRPGRSPNPTAWIVSGWPFSRRRSCSASSRKSRCIQQQIKSFLLQFSIPEPEGLSNWTNAAVEELRHTTLLPELRFCLDMLLEEYQHAKQQLARLKQEIRKLAQAERHQETVRLLQSVPGVGAITSIVFRTELVDPGRFRDGRQVSKMLGLAPGVRASGETRREGNILRSGNKRLRSVLVESAWRWIAGDGHAAAIYHRLVRNTGSAKKAIVGMARRLGILLWRISVSRQVYQPG